MFTMNDLLEIAIKLEKNGETLYRDSVEKIEKEELKSMLAWMADEEAVHGKWFAEQKDKLSLEIAEARLKKMVPQALQEMMGDKTLSLDDIDFSRFTRLSQLLETFIGFEEDTIQFYELFELFIEDDTVLTGLRTILLEEKNHVETLSNMMAALPKDAV